MDKNLLDNMSGQELKEMIDGKVIVLEELDSAALEKLMNHEIDMLCFDMGNMDTISRCAKLINEKDSLDNINKDKVVSIIEQTQSKRVVIVDEESASASKARVIKKHSVILRRIGLVAAVLALMIATTALVSAAFGVDIFECISKIARQDEGSQLVVDNFTFFHNGASKNYSSVGEMVEAENLNIMYPAKFPKDVKVYRVILNQSESGNQQIQIITTDKNISLFIEKNGEGPKSNDKDYTVYDKNGKSYRIFFDNIHFAFCYYNDDYYYIQANSYEEIIFIIDNLKE